MSDAASRTIFFISIDFFHCSSLSKRVQLNDDVVNGKRNVTRCLIKRSSYIPWRCSNSKLNSICRCCSFYFVRELFLTATASLFGYVWRNYFKLILAPTIYSNWKSIQCVFVFFYGPPQFAVTTVVLAYRIIVLTHPEWRQIGKFETKESKKMSFVWGEARLVFNHNIFKAFCSTFTTWLREGYFNLSYFGAQREWGTILPERRISFRIFILFWFFCGTCLVLFIVQYRSDADALRNWEQIQLKQIRNEFGQEVIISSPTHN